MNKQRSIFRLRYAVPVFFIFALMAAATFFSGCSVTYRETPEQMRRRALDHFGRGRRLEKKGDYANAVRQYLKAEKLSPRPAVYYRLGHCYMEMGEPRRAEKHLEKALELAPDYRRAQIELARARIAIEKPEKAPQKATAEQQKSGDSPDRKKEQVEETPSPLIPVPSPVDEKDQTESKEPLPSEKEVKNVLFPGLYEGDQKEHQEELEKVNKYIERKKKSLDDFSFHLDKARYYREHDMYKPALLEYSDALEINPGSLSVISEMAGLYGETGREKRGEELFQNAPEKVRLSPRFHLKWGNYYLNLGRLDMAAKKYKDTLELAPDYPAALNNLGIVELRKENYARAADYFQSALDVDSTFASAHLNLGIVCSDYLKVRDKAREHFQSYIRLGGERVDEVRKWLKNME